LRREWGEIVTYSFYSFFPSNPKMIEHFVIICQLCRYCRIANFIKNSLAWSGMVIGLSHYLLYHIVQIFLMLRRIMFYNVRCNFSLIFKEIISYSYCFSFCYCLRYFEPLTNRSHFIYCSLVVNR